jgi:hypothetical protein
MCSQLPILLFNLDEVRTIMQKGLCCESSIVKDCILSNNGAGVDRDGYGGGGGVYGMTICNCTIVENDAWHFAASGGDVNHGAVYNSIVMFNASPGGSNYGASSMQYSCSYPLPAGPGNISNDPQFVDSLDFHLSPYSACNDAGTNAYVTCLFDLDGSDRIINGIVDMGCCEAPVPEPCASSPCSFLTILLAGKIGAAKTSMNCCRACILRHRRPAAGLPHAQLAP